MRIKLDRTICDGFGACAKRAPQYFSLDDWGYASLIGDGSVRAEDQPAVLRAILDCPVHAIVEMSADKPVDVAEPSADTEIVPPAELKTEANEAEWGFTR